MPIQSRRSASIQTKKLDVIQSASLPVGTTIGGAPMGLTGDGAIFYKDSGNGDDTFDGKSPTEAFATMQTAIDACVAGRGDVIYVLPGGEEVTETVNFNKAGITVIAATYGVNRFAMGELFSLYAATSFTDGPAATITARCTIAGMGFVSRDVGATFWGGAALLIGGEGLASPFGTHILNCRFPKWNFDNRIGLAIEGSSDTLIEGCSFEGVGAAFDSGIYLQGAAQNIDIIGNRFRQCTYGLALGAFAGGGPHLMYGDCVFEDSKILSAGSAATGMIYGHPSEGATDTGSYSVTVDTLNGYGLVITDVKYAE